MRAGAFWAVAGQRVPPRQLTGHSPLHSGEERAGRVLPQRALDHRGRLGPARGQHRPALRARGRGGPGARAAPRSRPHLRAPGHRGEGRPVPRRPRGRVPGGGQASARTLPPSSSARSPTRACATSTTCPWAAPGPASAGATARGVTAAPSAVEVSHLHVVGARGGNPGLGDSMYRPHPQPPPPS